MTEQVSTEGTESTPTNGQAPQTVDQLPEWARNKISELRDEAAKYRTSKNSAVEEAKAAVSAEFEAKLAEAEKSKEDIEAERDLAKLDVVKLRAAFGALSGDKAEETLSRADEFAGLIQGSNADEIATHASKLAGLFGTSTTRTPAVDRSPEGGDPALALNGDPLLQSLKSALGIN